MIYRFSLLLALVGFLSFGESEPRANPSIAFWFKSENLSNLKDGEKVSNWLDHNSGVLSAIQKESWRQPIYVKQAIFSRSAISFNGYSHYLNLPDNSALQSLTAFDFFAVIRPERFSYYQTLFGIGKNGNRLQLGFLVDAPYLFSLSEPGSSFVESDSLEKVIENRVCLLEYQLLPSEKYQLVVDGRVAGSGSLEGMTGSIHDSFRGIGGNPDSKEFFEGDIAEVVLYNRALGNEEALAISCYLASKYGLIVSGCSKN